VRKQHTKGYIEPRSFCAGVAFAFLLLLITAGAALAYVSSQGVTVVLDSEQMAELVSESIAEQAKEDLPKIIAGAKSEIPGIVDKEMRDQLSSDRMEIAGFVFRMPEELTEQLRKNMQKNVEKATGQILDGIDTTMLADEFGRNAYSMVRDSMQNEFDGQTFRVMLFNRIPLAVRISMQ
jgi:F0F1-type ATP synthase membrane subunit b/b'